MHSTALTLLLPALLFIAPALTAQGPIVLMGIDAEDVWSAAHGPASVYAEVLSKMLDASGSSGGILVIGGGKDPTDDVTSFWNQIGMLVGISPDFVHGSSAIARLTDLSTYKLVAVASSDHETPSGGLTDAENYALARQSALIREFVNDHGGGLFSTSQAGLANPYGYLGGLASIGTSFPGSGYDDVTPTGAGLALGITDALDVCCWHDEYHRYPDFLEVLAVNARSNEAAALGGTGVRIEPTDNCTVPRPYEINVPIWSEAPLCNCLRDHVSRAFGCRINTPDFLFERWIPWPLVPGQEFTIRYEMTAFADIEGFTWTEALPDGFPIDQAKPAIIEFGPLSANQSTTTSLGFIAPVELGDYEGRGTLVAADGREHRSLNQYEVAEEATTPPNPGEPGEGERPGPSGRGFSWWWLVLTVVLVIAAWSLASRHQRSSRD